MSKYDRNYVDKIIDKIDEGLEQAKASGASAEALASIASARQMLLNKNKYTAEACSDDSAICRQVEVETYSHDWKGAFDAGKTQWHFKPIMVCGHLEGQFLKSLVSISKAKRVLEVGMFTGYSALSMAEALPADGEMVSLEICDYLKPLVEQLTKDSPHRNKMKCIIGHATDEMKKLAKAGEQFDIIFLDGDKKDYVDQFKLIFDENLLSSNGTVLVDNAYHMGQAYTQPDTITPGRLLLQEVEKRPELHRVMLPINDGVLMIRRVADVEGAVA